MKLLGIIAILLLSVISVHAGTVTLNWGTSTGATGYNVYVDGAKTMSTTGLSASVKVINGKHAFYVTAYNDRGESPPSNTVYTPELCAAASDLLLASLVGTKATFTWGKVIGADEYFLYVNGTRTPAGEVDLGTGAATVYITASNGWGEGPPSNTVLIAPMPGAPAGVRYVITALD